VEQSADTDSSRNGARASAEDAALDGLLRAVAHAPRAHREPEIADVVGGRYVIESVLGRGGMGVVFAARDRRTNKALALKWMATSSVRGSESDRRAALVRFEREAHIAARIAHPNLVDVYDVSIEPDAAYLVMERLEG
jgi:eukaryotic-like serine/threonine-protein kinase